MNNNNNKVSPIGGDLEGIAAIFDMDGTLIDNTPYHYQAWQQLFKKYDIPDLSRETYLSSISGVPILNTLKKYFGEETDEAKMQQLIKEKKDFYEQAFKPFLRPINGLETFLTDLKNAGVKMALATSSNMDDVEFIFGTIPIRKYFDAIIIGSMVSEPKPSPLIFLKAAEHLNTRPEKCAVFEDSISGLKAGRNAGMKVVGITTAHPPETVTKLAELVINDYADIDLHKMAALF
ncbi:beta-phosphoglucomutase [Mucilaginibacter sp. UYNi724]